MQGNELFLVFGRSSPRFFACQGRGRADVVGLSAFGNEGGGIADGGCGRQAGVVRRWRVLARVVVVAARVVSVLGDRNEIDCGDIGDAIAPEILLQAIGGDEDSAVEEFGMRL